MFCSGSNTQPDVTEQYMAFANAGRFKCSSCGRTVKITKNGLSPTHLFSSAPSKQYKHYEY